MKVNMHGLVYTEFDGDRVHGRNISKLSLDLKKEYMRLMPALIELGARKIIIDTINNTITAISLAYAVFLIALFLFHILNGTGMSLYSPLLSTLPVLILIRCITFIENMLYTKSLMNYLIHIESFARRQIEENPDILFSPSITSRYYFKIYQRIDYLLSRDYPQSNVAKIMHLERFLKDRMSVPVAEAIKSAACGIPFDYAVKKDFKMFTLLHLALRTWTYITALVRSSAMPRNIQLKAINTVLQDFAYMNPSLAKCLSRIINKGGII